MKTLLTAILVVVTLTGCAPSRNSAESVPSPDVTEAPSYPTPSVVDNAIPKSCDLPELSGLLSEITGGEVSAAENPVNSENSTEEDIQSYLAGRYLVCIYSEPESTDNTYVIWDESVKEDWLAVMDDANQNLEPGEGLYEKATVGQGEIQAFVLLEGVAEDSVFTGHTFRDDVSVLVYSSSLTDLTQGKNLLSAALKSMP
jgi:hypothetical protein